MSLKWKMISPVLRERKIELGESNLKINNVEVGLIISSVGIGKASLEVHEMNNKGKK